eukprot:TCALIF_06886-PA protein Name:"Protein of unknown function" AED:0.00 eAED:0.00 QI:107/1/1/1/1/1/2/122/169
MILFAVFLFAFMAKSCAFEILQHGGRSDSGQDIPFTDTIRIEEGSSLLLHCQTNDFIRSCTWSHKGQICRLKYSNAAHSLVKNTCDDLQSRVDVRGDYDSHECGLVIRNVTPEDSGLWGCYVTEYISKLALFKEPERKAALTRVQVVPKEDKGGLQGRASFCECDCGKN